MWGLGSRAALTLGWAGAHSGAWPGAGAQAARV